ncbi:MAG TPA: hypothetical protein VHE10_03315 [Candidatus Paceibacterota bacterium]|nr:hypothetical protein [Candidatus Paceibacterota bacterium]
MPVEFEENNFEMKRNFYSEPAPKFASWLISHHLAKDVAGANKLQVFAACLFFALAIYFAFF